MESSKLQVHFCILKCNISLKVENDNWSLLEERKLTGRFVTSAVRALHANVLRACNGCLNTLRTGDADLRFYITTVQDG